MEHTPAYQKIHTDMEKIYTLQEKYGLSEPKFKAQIDNLDRFQVVTPVVGKFSTGKSSLLNALLGKNSDNKWYLGTNLTPETAVPTEICYGADECAILFTKSGEVQRISVQECIGQKHTVEEVKKIRLVLNHDFLREISSVKIVDMPGFDSGIELHNRAIDDYLPESHAYILAFAATEPLISESIANFLRELHLHDMPVYVLITKSQSVTKEQLAECTAAIEQDAAQYLGLSHVDVACTNAKGRVVDIEALKKILRKIEAESQNLFLRQANLTVRKEAGSVVLYLRSTLKQMELAPSELAAQEEEHRKQIEHIKRKLDQTKQDFSRQVDISVDHIKANIQSALHNASGTLATMLLQRMDITYKVNMIVRENAIASIKEDFEPRLQKYMKRIEDVLKIDIAELTLGTDVQVDNSQIMLDNTLKETIKKSLPAILSVVGISLTGPIGAVVGLVLGLFVDNNFAKRQQDVQRQQAQSKILNEVIPQVVSQAGEAVSEAIYGQVDHVHQVMEQEAQNQIEIQEKALANTMKARESEDSEREKKISEMKADLGIVETFLSNPIGG